MIKSRGRKKFCLSKRVEEYHYIESDSSDEESIEDDNISSIFQIIHQKALKRSKQLEIKEKVQNEYQSREKSYQANYQQSSSNNTSEEFENETVQNNYSTRQNSRSNQHGFTSTPRISPRITDSIRQINKLALSRIEAAQSIPDHSFQSINRSYNYNNEGGFVDQIVQNNYSVRQNSIRQQKSDQQHTFASRISPPKPISKIALSRIEATQAAPNYSYKSVNTSPYNDEGIYQEPFNHQKTNRKSTVNFKRRQSAIPFERLQKLANDSPYMSPLSPNLAKTKRMKRRATMMSTFKTYSTVNQIESNNDSSNQESSSISSYKPASMLSSKNSIKSSEKKNSKITINNSELISDDNEDESSSFREDKKKNSTNKSNHSDIITNNGENEISSSTEDDCEQLNESEIATTVNSSSMIKNSKVSSKVNNSSKMENNSAILSTDDRSSSVKSKSKSALETSSSVKANSTSRKANSSIKSNSSIRASSRIKANSEILSTIDHSSKKMNSEIFSNYTNESVDTSSSAKRKSSRRNSSEMKMSINSEIVTNDNEDNEISSLNEDEEEMSVIKPNNSEIVTTVDISSVKSDSEIESNVDNDLTSKVNSEILTTLENSTLKTNSKIVTSIEGSSLKENSEIVTTVQCSTEKSNSEIESNINPSSSKIDSSEIVTDVQPSSSEKVGSEIFSNYIADLDGTSPNLESEKSRNSVRSTMPDLLDDFDDVDEDMNLEVNNQTQDDKYSKINEKEESNEQQSSNEQHSSELEENSEEMIVDLVEEVEESIKESAKETTSNALSDLENSSFSRIEENCSKISVSFEPSINNSIDHLQNKNNESEIAFEDEQQEQNTDTEFKRPTKPPARKLTSRTVVKKQPKYYETMVNNTPTIIYPYMEGNDGEEVDQDGSIRRSSRIRVKPLEYWRNQKLKYKIDTETKCYTIDGVEKGFKPENPFTKKYTKQPKSNKNKLKEKKSRLPRIKEENVSDEESTSSENESSDDERKREPIEKVRYSPNEVSIHIDLNESAVAISERIKREAAEFYSKSDLVWNAASQSKGVYLALMNRKKLSKNGTQASGFIKMIEFAEKPEQTTTDYITKYVVMFGAVSVQIGGKPAVILKSMDSFTVEKRTKYSIRNLRKDEALLYFDVCRSN